MVSEWDLCTGPDPGPQPRFLQIATSWINEMHVVNFRDVYSDRDRPVHGKIKYNTLVDRWDDDETMTFYFTGLKSGRMMETTIISCDYHFKDDEIGFTYHNLLVLKKPSLDGDSGALVVTEEGDKVVGIIFACKRIDNIEHALAASIEDVEKSLQVCLIKTKSY